MAQSPEVLERPEQPYVAVRATLSIAELPSLGQRLGEVFGWLGGHGLTPSGPPFFKYNVIDMPGRHLRRSA